MREKPAQSRSSSRASDTRERVLDASQQLFNAQGFHNVAAMRIAAQVGMSPGHLAYHFRSKNEIAEALFLRLEADLQRSVWDAHLPEGEAAGVDAIRRQVSIFAALWRHRFLFNALARFMAQESPLQARYRQVEDRFVESMCGVFADLQQRGEMRAIVAPNTPHLLARSIWMIYLSWLRHEQLLHGDLAVPDAAAVRNGLMQVYSILQPYLSASLAQHMLDEITRTRSIDAAPGAVVKKARAATKKKAR